MPLTARCHSLRPDKSTGWLVYFELAPRGSRTAHFLVVGPARVGNREDVETALRAGQAAVRYLKEVPEHAPPVTLLEATARILAHEFYRSGTELEYGCAVLEGEQLWLLTRGAVRVVPLEGEDRHALLAEKPQAFPLSADQRLFLGRIPSGMDEEHLPSDFIARLEHGGGGEGGLILQTVAAAVQPVSPTPSTARQEPVFDAVLEDLQDTFAAPVPSPSSPSVPTQQLELESVPPSSPVESETQPPEEALPAPAPKPVPPGPPRVEEPLTPDSSGGSKTAHEPPEDPAGHAGRARSDHPPPVFAPEETKGLGFWLGLVTAGVVLAVLVGYFVFFRPDTSPQVAGDSERSALAGGETVAVTKSVPEGFTPEVMWEDRFAEAVTSSPLIVGESVIFGCRDGRVYAVNRWNGRRVWAYAAGQGFGSSPALAGETIVIGGYDGRIYGLDAATGEERWVVRTRGRVVASPAVAGGTAFVGSYDHVLYAISVADGSVRWQRDLGAVLWSSPAVSGSFVIAAGLDGKITAMDRTDGRVYWRAQIEDAVYSSPVIAEKRVVVGSQDGHLYALEVESGQIAWSVELGGDVDGSPAYHEGRIVVGTDVGTVHGLDLKLGEEVWRQPTGGEVKSRPAFWDNTVWVTCYDGSLYGFRWLTGEIVTRVDTESSAYSSPAVVEGVAYFGAMDGRFLAVRLARES